MVVPAWKWLTGGLCVALAGCSLVLSTSELSGGEAEAVVAGADASAEGAALPDDASTAPAPVTLADGAVVQVLLTAAGDHTCAAVSGVAWCWGSNTKGELGDGTKQNRLSPTRVTGLPTGAVTAIAAGQTHSCAVVSGDVWCWGSAGSGELGLPSAGDQPAPVKVPGLPAGQAIDVNAGLAFSCAAMKDGSAYCWGSNGAGRLGDGTTIAGRPDPQPVVTSGGALTGVVQIAGANDHACARTGAGVAYCWGHDDNGALGDPAVGDSSNVAVSVKGLPGPVSRIEIGGWHACALLAGGSVHCWGTGTAGELGNGLTSNSNLPVPVTGLDTGATWIAVAGGPTLLDASCAIRGGKVSCWGNGQLGRLGDQGTSPRPLPNEVPLPGPAVAVAGGFAHFCALLASGTVHCWGSGTAGQLGDGSGVDRPVPVPASL